uniref:CST complex subunit CTC1 n=2 Tax=Oncorhynchus kisutch TaxID=8019 RepID=A0A8C7JCM2_ONCKI
MESFMDNFRERSEVEREWLQELFVFVRDNLFPVLGPTTGSVSPEQLSLAMIRRVERAVGSSSARSLPLSYRLISVAELVTWQRTPCCSNLTWSTAQHREWVREAEQALPNHKALPRASLLLIGCLSDGCDPERSCDGAWRVRDATGTVHCELLSPSPLWLGLPVLFPCWNYIPQPALGKDQEVEERGYLELVGCPLPLTSDIEMTFNPAGVNLKRAVGVREAAELIQHRVRGLRVKVYGEVSGVYPLLNIAGKSLFCLRLREGRHTLPLLVTEPCCLWWQQCVCVGGSVCVSGLRVCALQGWSGNRILCATSQSSLTLLPDTLIQDLSDPPTLDKHTLDPDPVGIDPPLSDCSSTGCPLPERRGAGPDPDPVGLDPPLSDCSSTGCPLPERRGAGPDPDPVGIDPPLSDCSSTRCPLPERGPDPDPVGIDPPLSDCSSTRCPLPERGPDPDPVGIDPPLSDCSSTRCPLPERGPDPDPVGIDPPLSDCSSTRCPLPERGPDPDPSPILRPKLSKAISYKGVLTSVLSAAAGLYVIDGKVGLCLAYQPLQRRGLRPGAEIELHDVHFLYRPSPHFHPCMLCVCLHSSLRVTSFSRLGSEVDLPSDAPLPWLLLERNLGVSQYLWLCHCCRALRDRLVPRWVKEECVYVVARRLFECVVTSEKGGGRRDIYREMLQEPHHCPLTEYSVSSPVCEYVSVSDCVCVMEKECWSSLSLSSLLPACGSSLTQAELNPSIAWSVGLSLGQDSQPRPLLLVGVLELPGTHTLRLRDQTGAVTCVAVETGDDDSGGQRAANNTAWIGCLVCVQRFTMVMERFLQSEFPSYRHLDQDSYITDKHCRVYIQLCLNDLQILRPSAAMASLLLRENIRTTQGGERVEGGEREEMSETEREKGGEEREGRREKWGEEREGRREKGGEEREERREKGGEEREGRREKGGEEREERREKGGEEREERREKGGEEREERREKGGEERRRDDVSERKKRSREEERIEENKEEREGGAKRARQNHTENETCSQPGGGASLPGDRPCISVVMCVEGKEGVAWRNEGIACEGEEAGLSLCFSVRADLIGQIQRWGRDPRNCPLQERETDGQTRTVELLFVRSSVRWFPLIQAGSFYRLIAPNTQDPSVLIGCRVAGRSGVVLHTNPSLLVRSDWRIHTLTHPLLTTPYSQFVSQKVMSVAEVLDCSSGVDLVSFHGVISQRITLQRGTTTHTPTQRDVEAGLSVRLTVCVEPRGRSLQVYLDLSLTPYPPGLVPGNTVQFTSFQRRLSRVGGVYCRSVPVSCLTIMALGKTDTQSCDSPPPIILLGVWALAGAEQCILGRVRGHVVCVLYLQLQWTCSLCGSIYTQERCTRSQPPCNSTSAVFQAEAKAAVEDGSGEAHIWFSCPVISGLLGLAMPQWEGLQRSLRVRGHLRVYTRGRSLVCDVDADDPLLHYLSCVCSSSTVCRPLTLICTLHTRSHTPAARREDSAQLKRFTRGDREFVTRMPPPLQLTCTHILEERERD